MELDEVIDQMIAERVIHRHRRKWIAFFVLLVAAILTIWVLNGWDEPTKSTLKTVQAPYTFDAGRFRFEITGATLHRTPKGKYTDASAEMILKLGITNIDSETQKSGSVSGDLLYLVPKKGELIASNGATCHGDLNYKLVYGLGAEDCTAKFKLPATYTDTAVRIGIVTEEFRSDEGIIGATDQPYWREGPAGLIVELTAEESAK